MPKFILHATIECRRLTLNRRRKTREEKEEKSGEMILEKHNYR
jgi:hypothetical protein